MRLHFVISTSQAYKGTVVTLTNTECSEMIVIAIAHGAGLTSIIKVFCVLFCLLSTVCSVCQFLPQNYSV